MRTAIPSVINWENGETKAAAFSRAISVGSVCTFSYSGLHGS